MRRWSLRLLSLYLVLGLSASAVQAAPAAEGKKPKKKKPAESAEVGSEGAPPATPKPPSAWFPDWSPADFSWGIRPIVGYQQSSQTQAKVTKTSTNAFEAGLSVYLANIALAPNNPGLRLSPKVGYAQGQIKSQSEDLQTKSSTTASSRFTRSWAEANLIGYYHYYRHTLGLNVGEKQYSGDLSDKVQSRGIYNDFGILMLPWFSSHLTHSYNTAYLNQIKKPYLTESDVWLHANLFFDILSLHLETGPGFTVTESYSITTAGALENRTDSLSQDYRSSVGLRIFWKLGATASAKYIYAQSAKRVDRDDRFQLPNQDLQDADRAPLPQGTLASTLFVGLFDLFGGLGVGWHQNAITYHAFGGGPREETRQSGFGLSYQAAL